MRFRQACCLLVLGAVLGAPASASITVHALARPEGPRHYIVAEPAGLPKTGRPLVILLHGHGASAAMMVGLDAFAGYKSQDWIKLAEREKFLLIAPDGVVASDGKRAWNDCRGDATTNAATDDVGFLSALIKAAVAQWGADPDRIYVFGGSNGGGMAYRAGIELAPQLAAIGVVNALMPVQSACKAPSQPLPVFISHGTADRIAPYAGGKVDHWLVHGRGSGISAEASAAIWRKLGGLPEAATVYRFPHLHPDDPTSAMRYLWGADPAGMQVEFVRIEGGGHAPSSTDEELPWLLRTLVGNMNHDVNTADEAWRFFKDKRNAGKR